MSTTPDGSAANTEPQEHDRSHRVLYLVIASLLLVAVIVGIVAFEYGKSTQESRDKASRVIEKWQEIGLAVPENDDVLVRLYGTDGGAVCTTTTDDLTEAFLVIQLANGASGPGQRPVTVDQRVVQGERAVVEVYCPERLDAFDAFVDDLDFDDVIRED